MFLNAIDWALGVAGPPVALEILSISMNFPPGNTITSLEFTSRAAQEYTILISTSLESLAAGNRRRSYLLNNHPENDTTAAMTSFLNSNLSRFFSVAILFLSVNADAAPIAGADFSNGAAFDTTPDDLVAADGITVSGWVTSPDGSVGGNGSGNSGRVSAPIGKFNGPSTSGVPPLVGSAPPTQGMHSFSITIPAGITINLTRVTFDFSRATSGSAQRWLAFRTSLDSGLLFSQVGVARPTWDSVDLQLSGAKYEELNDETVTFYWYSGGEGSGDCDIDSIVIEAEEAASLSSNGD